MKKLTIILTCLSLVAISVSVSTAHDNGSPPVTTSHETEFKATTAGAMDFINASPYVVINEVAAIECEAPAAEAVKAETCIIAVSCGKCHKTEASYLERLRPVNITSDLKTTGRPPSGKNYLKGSAGGLAYWRC